MPNFVPNIAKGRAAELYDRVKNGDPAAARLYIIPIAAGSVTDEQMRDADTFADIITLGVTELTTGGWNRKTLAAADIATGSPDDTNNRNDRNLPTQTWTSVSGSASTDLVVCYASVGSPTNAQLVPLTVFDFVQTPSGANIEMTGGVFFRATEPA